MGTVIAIVVALILVVGVVAFLLSRRRAAIGPPAATSAPPAKVRPPDEPMTGLESALAQVTDRNGKPIRDRIEAEAGHVDELRVPDDTSPLLRRALDHVAPGQTAPDAKADSADGAEPGADDPAQECGSETW